MPRSAGQIPIEIRNHRHYAEQIVGEEEDAGPVEFVTHAELAETVQQLATDGELDAAVETALGSIVVTQEISQNFVTQEFVTELVTNLTEVSQSFITNEFVTELVTNLTQVSENNEYITEITQNDTFVTNLTTLVTELTEITQNNTYVTNLITQITAQVNGKKGVANELATLGADSLHTPAQIPPGMISVIFDGGPAPIEADQQQDIEIPFACNLIGWTLLADRTGSIVIDVWRDSYANYPPTVADTIATSKPTLSSATKAQDNTITDWTEAIPAGSILRFNVDSAAIVRRVTLTLKFQRT